MTKKAEVDSRVQEIIGLSKDQFLKSVLLAQGDFTAFLKAKPAERADILEKMTSTEEYRKLSKRAFEKKKEEEAKMQRLNDQLDAIQVLPAEEEQVKRAELGDLEQQAFAIRGKKKEYEAAKGWHDVRERLTDEYNKAQVRHQQALLSKEREVDAFLQWQQHEQVLPFETRIHSFRQNGSNLDALRAAVIILEGKVDTCRAKWDAADRLCKEAQDGYNVASNELQKQRPTLQQAMTVATILAGEEKRLNELCQRIANKSGQFAAAKSRLGKAEAEKEKAAQELQELNQWLHTHQGDSRLRDVAKDCGDKLTELVGLRAKAEGHQRDAKTHKTAFDKASSKETVAKAKSTDAGSQIGLLQTRNDELVRTLSQWHCFGLQHKAESEAALEDLEQRLQQIVREIAADDFYLAHYNALTEGEPCPLCGSSEHPDAQRDVSETKRRVEDLKQLQKSIERERKATRQDFQNAGALVAQLSGLPIADSFSADFTKEKLSDIQSLLTEYLGIPAQLANQSREQVRAQDDVTNALAEKETAQEQVLAAEKELSDVSALGAKSAAFFEQVAAQYIEQIKQGKEQAVIAAFEARADAFAQQQVEAGKISASLPDKESAIANEQNAIVLIESELSDWRSEEAAALVAYENQKKENTSRFPPSFASAQAYLEHLEKQEQGATQLLKGSQDAVHQAKSSLHAEQKLFEAKAKEHEEKTLVFEDESLRLSEDLTNAGLADDIDAAAARLLDAALRQKVKNWLTK